LSPCRPVPGVNLSDYLGVLGTGGHTAYWGLKDVAKLKEGENVVVSGAAGAIGTVACQIAKNIYKSHVVAIAGSKEKCDWLVNTIGVDVALNYKDADFIEQFKSKVEPFDVMFDNVGGEILNVAMTRLKPFARIAFCGSVSAYNESNPKGPASYLNLISQRGTLQGFMIPDYMDRFAESEQALTQWVLDGKIKPVETRVKGIENAPFAFVGLFKGANTGKMLLDVKSE